MTTSVSSSARRSTIAISGCSGPPRELAPASAAWIGLRPTPLPPPPLQGRARGRSADACAPMSLGELLRELDRRQQRRPRVGFIAALIKKFSDDQAGQLAALIAYYGFVSIFPLLLVLVTALGFVLQGDPREQQRILNGALGQFPILRDQLKLHSLSGSSLALAVGIAISLLAGMGITNATQNAFNRIWNVPFKQRPNFISIRLRGLGMLAVLGAMS